MRKLMQTDFEEIKTSSFIRSKLDDYGIPYTTSAKTGTVALIKGKNSNKTVLLRADIDGLPIKDESKFEIKSEREGYMHACGHDIHATCLLGAAKILNDIKDDADFEHCTTLIDDAVLDSFDILSIISALNDHYDIQIPASDIVPANFNSAAALLAMVQRLQAE